MALTSKLMKKEESKQEWAENIHPCERGMSNFMNQLKFREKPKKLSEYRTQTTNGQKKESEKAEATICIARLWSFQAQNARRGLIVNLLIGCQNHRSARMKAMLSGLLDGWQKNRESERKNLRKNQLNVSKLEKNGIKNYLSKQKRQEFRVFENV